MDLNSRVDARVEANVVQTDKRTDTQIPKVDVTMKKEKKKGVKKQEFALALCLHIKNSMKASV